ncbi:MAG: cold shock domain-containing protein [Rhodobacteraceae bacterium]|nr:cold shock domain-containing protein [Paracoccaceae bacterium]
MTTKSGSVKWFDSNKGFGFIADDEGGNDILLHANVLRNFGHSSVVEGTRIEVEVTQSQRGLQAVEITTLNIPEVDINTALRGIAELGIDFAALDTSGPLTPARVKWFDKVKGFGFVNVFESSEDVFVHMEVLRAYGMSELVQGEAICVRTAAGPRGKMAVEVRAWDFAGANA